ncbi:MAG: serine/threonine-protein kinase PknD [Mycobacterium sp.]
MGEQPDDARVGTQFGRYEIRALLGQAGVGQLYEAIDAANDRMVALRLLPPNLDRQRFFGELRIVAGLTEPHIIPLLDWGEIDGVHYAATRLVPGETLRSLVATFGPIDPARAVAIIEQVAAALDAAHAERLIHRDVKPENILVAGDGVAYLLGFGFADPALTAPGPTAGAYAYMAPERFDDEPLTNRVDVYSLACVLTEILTGDSPLPGATTVGQVIKAHLTAAPPKPSLLRPHVISPRFDAVIARGMAKNPQHRFATAGDLARAARDALEAAQDDSPTMVRRASDPVPQHVRDRLSDSVPDLGFYPAEFTGPAWRSWKLVWLAIGLAVLLVLAAAGIVVWRVASSGSADQPSGSTTAAPTTYRPTVLPFTGLTGPEGVAVDAAGSVYVTNIDNDRVMKLAAGSTSQTVLPFTSLKEPYGLAVDTDGGVYVADTDNDRVMKLAAGSTNQTMLPFTGLTRPQGLAVDAANGVYVADTPNNRVVKLAAGSPGQTVLPFTDLERPKGVAVDSAGSVYVADTGNNRVLKLAAGSSGQTVLPFTGLKDPSGLAADAAGDIYLTDGSRIVRLTAGSTKQTVLPVTDLGYTRGVAVGADGDVYVTDYGNDQVVQLVAS